MNPRTPDAFPEPLSPVYWTSSPHEPILLYEGDIRLTKNSTATVHKGQVLFHWLPSPRLIYWVGVEDTQTALMLRLGLMRDSEGSVELLNLETSLGAPPEATIDRSNFAGTTTGEMQSVRHGVKEGIKEVLLNVINFSPITGTTSTEVDGGFLRNRITLNWQEWSIILDGHPRLPEIIGELRGNGGYAFTHIARINRVTGDAFNWEDAEALIEPFRLFLSFAKGALVAPSLPLAFGESGQPQFMQWESSHVHSWRSSFSWLDPRGGDALESAFGRFMDRWTDEFWRDVLRRSIRIYVDANRPDPIESAIIMGQSALELLAWAVLVEQTGWIREGEGKLPASARLRLLLKRASIPTEIPDGFNALREAGEGKTPEWDGPKAVTEVRNALVHPKKADELREIEVLIETWRLALWYLELILLHVIGYAGSYGNRLLNERWAGQVEPVPWSTPDAADPDS